MLKPKGMWYSGIWVAWAKFHAIPVYWVGHAALKTLKIYRAGVRGNDIQTRLLFYVTRLLFQELLKTVSLE